jgi:riboflavin kinase/FMN adenylyltransferase
MPSGSSIDTCMKVTRGYSGGEERSYPVATVGNFDGHHLGHRSLLRTVVETARRMEGTALVLTFDPHPVKILAPHVDLKFLTSSEEKLQRFEDAGIDEVIVLEFDQAFASLSPETFTEMVLYRGLHLRQIFVGQHFVFGKGRTGNVASLTVMGKRFGFTVNPVSPVIADGGIVSSTRVRKLVQEGQVDLAARLLGRQYVMRGVVMPGVQRGQELGWPTANLRLPAERVIPPNGVYATVTIWNQQQFDSVAYIGSRPTFDAGERLMEVHLLNEQQDLYGESIEVQFLQRLRGDTKFPSGADLSRQIAVDVERAKAILQEHRSALPAG